MLGLFIDISKAFDSINHSIILDKLYCMGFRGLVHSWLTDYLSLRFQYIEVYGKQSNYRKISCWTVYYVVCDVSIFTIYQLVPARIAPSQAVAGAVCSNVGFLHNSLAPRFPFSPRVPPDETYNHVDGNRNTVSGSGKNGAKTKNFDPIFGSLPVKFFFAEPSALVGLSRAYLAAKGHARILTDGTTGRGQNFEGTNFVRQISVKLSDRMLL